MASQKYPTRKLGGEDVSAIGLGCMGMSFAYTSFGGYDDKASAEVLTKAADIGMTFWDTSDIYGPHTNEKLIGKWFNDTGRRKEIFLASKFGNLRDAQGNPTVRGDKEYVKKACHDSLERLGIDQIDLYYQHRVDDKVPIEETVGAMVELKKEGKIRMLGLSECSATTLRRACKVHQIAAAQMEFSPFALEIESEQTEFLKTARELGVKIVAYSPLGRGFLTGTIQSRDDLDPSDNRVNHPRFAEGHFQENLKLVNTLSEVARKKGCTPSQLALAWVLAQGDDFLPIPGTKRVKYLLENAEATNIKLSKEEESNIRKAIDSVGGTKGERYPVAMMAKCFVTTPTLIPRPSNKSITIIAIMKAGLLFVAGIAAAAAHPRRHQHPAKRQATDVNVVTVVDTVTAVEPSVIVYVDGDGRAVSTSFFGTPATTPTDTPSSVAPSTFAEPTTESSSGQPPPAYSSSDAAPAPSSAPSSAPTPTSSAAPGADFSGYTLSYSPYNSDNSCKSQDQVNTDFNVISGYGMIRIYGTDCDQTATVLTAVKAKGMKLFAGVYDVNNLNAEVQQIVNAANGDWSNFHTVSIGNEGVNNGAYSVDQVVSAIGTARSTLQAAGYTGNVVTVDTFVAMIANPQLCQASDYAAANCHPFFDGGVSAEDAGQFVLDQAQRVSEACGGKDTMITETGWPSDGETNGKAVPSQDNQVAAVNSIRTAFSNNVVLFSAFNDKWKQNNPSTFGAEQYWGIYGDAP
ncbi:hypothetical protein LTS16_021307 [Friedmanniomyces endolithicus]|nr:hypothetical protein LTR94_005582 [Friedmanniomyces endolithicus]KAK0788920.1 hypothetical protein LTR75_012476 [Friedmanniomyces endolithicus]KAK0804581.1 hypothetical protein LTR59_004327 [Friedmanniomyces endolithicus]KAK0816873.1 hypothetical protein LTR38_001903 [Friedmanniomyces endolithicus]KAK0856514.1 hypothetical protein LTR03_001251 [Friedmanniomyces endolithicus]